MTQAGKIDQAAKALEINSLRRRNVDAVV